MTPTLAFLTLAACPSSTPLESRIDRIMLDADVPGLSLARVSRGRLAWTKTFGRRGAMDRSSPPVDTDTVFEAASLGKPLVAVAALWLWERGRLDLDRPAQEVSPFEKVEDARRAKITPRMLLSHTSGLAFGQPKLDWEPGSVYSYSTEGNRYLQRIVEKKLGESLESWSQRTLFGPLGMDRTSFVYAERFAPDRATGRNWLDVGQEYMTNAAGTGAFDLITTARDYGRLWAGILSGRVLRPQTAAAMFSPQKPIVSASYDPAIPKKEKVELAAGLGLLLQKREGRWLGFQWGDNGGSTGYLIADLRTKDAAVFLSNAQDGLHAGGALVEAAGMKDQALEWLGYAPYDTVARRAWKRITAALAKDPSEGTELFLRMKASEPAAVSSQARNLGYYLKFKGYVAESESLFRAAIEHDPRDTDPYECLADALVASGRIREAAEAQARAIAIDPARSKDLTLPAWVRDAESDLSKRSKASQTDLASCVGTYGAIRFVVLDGALAVIGASGKAVKLVPVGNATFLAEDLTQRIRFDAKAVVVTTPRGESKEYPRREVRR